MFKLKHYLQTIKDRLETHTAQIEKLHNASPSTSSSLSKKEKKKMKELKKLKNKKFDDDKVRLKLFYAFQLF